MTAIMVMGLQWGDEGKGRVVDTLAQRAEVVVRFNGGPNAGHTIPLPGGGKISVHQLPSGVTNLSARLCLGRGMVVDIEKLSKEIAEVGVDPKRVLLDSNAQVIAPCHREEDGKAEDARGAKAIGTTKTGNGPAYADKYARVGVTVGSLIRNPNDAARRLAESRPGRDVVALCDWAADMSMLVADMDIEVGGVSKFLIESHLCGSNILFECAHGFELDIDHGDYPYVTSSSCGIGGVYSGAGFPPLEIEHVIGVMKPYSTRIGAGPFVPGFSEEQTTHIREAGGEYGVTTGRPRKIGVLDLQRLKRACLINSVDRIALTHLDMAMYLENVPFLGVNGERAVAPWYDLHSKIEVAAGAAIQYISDGPQHQCMQQLFGEEGTDADVWGLR
jgi:adenylosuccinate synthase